MDQVVELSKSLGNPGYEKLWKAVRKKKIPGISPQMVKNYVATRGEKQLFRPYPDAKGKTGSEKLDYRFQIDLIDLRTSPSKKMKYIIFLIDVFSRQVWCEPIQSKDPEVVAPVLADMLANLPVAPTFIFQILEMNSKV